MKLICIDNSKVESFLQLDQVYNGIKIRHNFKEYGFPYGYKIDGIYERFGCPFLPNRVKTCFINSNIKIL